jgi:hypothetical protein
MNLGTINLLLIGDTDSETEPRAGITSKSLVPLIETYPSIEINTNPMLDLIILSNSL